jgi:REP element-mobilizing transposase RayT
MSVGNKIEVPNGIFFITFTCADWLPLFQLTNGYDAIYNWFDYLKKQGHYIAGYVIMPNHIHALIAFRNSDKLITTVIANGKRFIAYDLVKRLKQQGHHEILEKLASLVNKTERQRNKQHEVFQPSFDRKECRSLTFTRQKMDYIHLNPCRKQLAKLPENYVHSSAKYYFTGIQGRYPVITYMELQDIDLDNRFSQGE